VSAPLVSVLMPTYDGAGFVGEALESALSQTYDRLEVVVADDTSTDETALVVADYALRHPDRVRLYPFQKREGPCRRRNDALARARGSLIAWLDQDDVWLPTKLERQVAAFADPSVGFVYSDSEEVDSRTGRAIPSRFAHRLFQGNLLSELFVEGCFPCSSTVVVRREAMTNRGLGFRDADFSFGDDYYLWLALSLDWRAACVRDKLVKYRRHERNESRRRPDENFHLWRVALLREFLGEFPEAREKLGPARRAGFARHHLRAARFEARRRRVARAAALGARGAVTSPHEFARALARSAIAGRRRVAGAKLARTQPWSARE
jgi:glycosyltransferase involved in cell wall biosynthesis